jgi:hypothetical protein
MQGMEVVMERIFGIASVVVVCGFVVGACSDDPSPANPTGVTDGGPDVKPPPDAEPAVKQEEKTVGKLCTRDADCEVADSVGDNVCSIGFFTIGDLFGDAVCVSPCQRGPGQTIADILCDGDETSAAGICNAPAPNASGVCLPFCQFGATAVSAKCQGQNQCAPQFFATTQAGEVISIGACLGACSVDADCKGSPGAKCQSEIGLCVKPEKYLAFAKVAGDACDGSGATDVCNCNTVGGTGANKDRGYCTLSCVTGAAGDAECGTAVNGWKCSAELPTKFADGTAAFTGQPDGVLGRCARPCTADADCTALGTTIGGGVTVKCEETAGFKICVAQN